MSRTFNMVGGAGGGIKLASISIITLLGYTAIAGAVGAGGLGDLAIRYGYQRNVPSMMLATVVLIIVLVQAVQFLGNWLARKALRH